ncbi:hypothetical protein DSO57_1020359 [Entomophthora muscae]|uniref:Uncharacterized protein n=1 Tax=Entomophthora muscae TaxID=34485 RepID=A0ACC2SSJ1_9FUNG|nr:hypothetical protein DSO57_1020359 [Entomophthora muscae]
MSLGAAISPRPGPVWGGSLNYPTPTLVGDWGFEFPSGLLQLPTLLLGGLVWGFEPRTRRCKAGSNTIPLYSPFVYSPSDPQENLFNFNHHSDPTSEPEEDQEQEPEPGAPADDQIEIWDVNNIHNIFNRNGAFSVPFTFPVSYTIMYNKGGAGFVYKDYSFNCNDEKKAICQHHFKCDTH